MRWRYGGGVSRLGSDAWSGPDGRVVCRLGQARRRFLSTTSGANPINTAAQGSTRQSTTDQTTPRPHQANSPTPPSTAGAGTESALPRSDWWPSALAVGQWRTSRHNWTRRKLLGPGAPPSVQRIGPG